MKSSRTKIAAKIHSFMLVFGTFVCLFIGLNLTESIETESQKNEKKTVPLIATINKEKDKKHGR